jgi:hypothetical protein
LYDQLANGQCIRFPFLSLNSDLHADSITAGDAAVSTVLTMNSLTFTTGAIRQATRAAGISQILKFLTDGGGTI